MVLKPAREFRVRSGLLRFRRDADDSNAATPAPSLLGPMLRIRSQAAMLS